MFIQVIHGKVRDEAGLRRNMERWRQELMPGARGYLGTTAGVTEDDTFVALARFDSEEAARANSDRPEQGAWWAETEKCFDGAVAFLDCADVRPILDGGSDDAGFVQVILGRSDDASRMHGLLAKHTDEMQRGRPDIVGGLSMELDDGRYVDALYFTSEVDARAGEQKEMPDGVRADIEEAMRLRGEVTYFDLREPMLVSP